jgi:hypothetical protein
MSLRYKPDWEEAKQRYLAWWQGEYFGRCLLSVTGRKEGTESIAPPTRPEDPVARWTDLSYIAELNEWQHATTFWGGEAFPIWSGGYPGHTAIPAFLGCPTTLDLATGWWDPVLIEDDWDITRLELQTEERWWQFAQELLKTAAEASEGRSLPSIGAFGGCGDTLAALRGTEPLLFDCIERPEKVKAAELWLMDMWCGVYDTLAAPLDQPNRGCACWFPLWAPERFYPTQCDFAYNISPTMFRELFLPAVERQTRFLRYTVYHLDGIGNFVHLPALLEVPGIQAIQVLPGAGKPSPLRYPDLLRQVQAAGRNLTLELPPQEVEEALSLLSARGLFIETWCDTEQEARDLLHAVEHWSKE